MFKQAAVHKKSKKRLLWLLVIPFVLAVIAVGIIAYVRHDSATAKPKNTQQITAAQNSMFSFDTGKANAWTQGPKNSTSIAMFYKHGDCFTSLGQNPGSIDDQDQSSKAVALMQSQGDQNVTVTNLPLELQTNKGPLAYTLHQYRSGGGTSSYYQFEEAAYIPNGNSYIGISAYCKDGSNLNATIDALNATSVTL